MQSTFTLMRLILTMFSKTVHTAVSDLKQPEKFINMRAFLGLVK